MHVVIRKHTASPDYMAEVRPTLAKLEETMRAIPGFVAYYFVETDDGIATITITEDETGTAESMGHAARWIAEETPLTAPSAPEVTQGHALISATR
jgi:quinol monooxygenase YgiN